jgi:dTDP-4-dehydrorhamnose reductase
MITQLAMNCWPRHVAMQPKTCISPWNSQAQSGRGRGCMQGSKLLIVGFSGYIGARIISRIGLQNVIATYRGNYVNGGVPFDVSMMRLADRFLRGSHGISHAMLLQRTTKIDRCAEAPVETAKVNVGSTIRAIDDLLNASVKPIFISSDAVFDGTQHLATEDDAVCPSRHTGSTSRRLMSTTSWTLFRAAL